MMEKEKLRKADIFSGGIIFLFGLWIVSQALKMPMKDSWGGVQNVWFVSPALFPLFVGAMIMLLGALLIRIAFREVGSKELKRVLRWLGSPDMIPISEDGTAAAVLRHRRSVFQLRIFEHPAHRFLPVQRAFPGGVHQHVLL